jgi:hypothetical protein
MKYIIIEFLFTMTSYYQLNAAILNRIKVILPIAS